jgi:hypothetical protein
VLGDRADEPGEYYKCFGWSGKKTNALQGWSSRSRTECFGGWSDNPGVSRHIIPVQYQWEFMSMVVDTCRGVIVRMAAYELELKNFYGFGGGRWRSTLPVPTPWAEMKSE